MTLKTTLNRFYRFIGFAGNKTSHWEKLISGLGGCAGILLILLLTRQFVGGADASMIVASMGASAVLLFAVPHGPLSQPWALIGGHMISALVGVSCYLHIPDLYVSAAVAVGLSITAMYYLRCIHPPGGATALTAVVAGNDVHSLGYQYLMTPVLINVLIIFMVAIAFNFLFRWRRYPASIVYNNARQMNDAHASDEGLASQDLDYALKQMNLFVNVGSEELGQIYRLARNRVNHELKTEQIQLGRYYSNGEYGSDWQVRQVVDESGNQKPDHDQIIYKVVAGKNRRSSDIMKRDDFATWAKYEVFLNENSWQRVTADQTQIRTKAS